MKPHPAVLDVGVSRHELCGCQLERHGVDVESFQHLFDGNLLQLRSPVLVCAVASGAAFHLGHDRREQRSRPARQIDCLVVPPHVQVRPVQCVVGVNGVQREPPGNGRRDRTGEERSVGGLVAHDLVEKGAGMVGAHVGVGLCDLLCLGREMP